MPTIRRFAKLLAIATFVGLSAAWVYWAVDGLTLSDADAYRAAANRLLAGEDLYIVPRTQGDAFRYAPWFALIWIPLAALPEWAANTVWLAALAMASTLAVVPLARAPSVWLRLTALLGGSVLIWTAARGNVHPLVVLALVWGIDRRTGPIWIALTASLKAVPILFALVYVARREWRRAFVAVAVTVLLVAPMPFFGWDFESTEAGPSLSLYYLVSPAGWVIGAGAALLAATVSAMQGWPATRLAAATAAIAVLPRLLLYDATYLLPGLTPYPTSRPEAATPQRTAS
ncbi:MAG TPA: glycosyltransferase 87 family protein [Hyphomicrobiaceae bacterium]